MRPPANVVRILEANPHRWYPMVPVSERRVDIEVKVWVEGLASVPGKCDHAARGNVLTFFDEHLVLLQMYVGRSGAVQVPDHDGVTLPARSRVWLLHGVNALSAVDECYPAHACSSYVLPLTVDVDEVVGVRLLATVYCVVTSVLVGVVPVPFSQGPNGGTDGRLGIEGQLVEAIRPGRTGVQDVSWLILSHIVLPSSSLLQFSLHLLSPAWIRSYLRLCPG